MDLTFRRRPLDDEAADYRARCAAYWDFLDGFDHAEQPDLYRYFGWDPFHDGPIERLRFSPDARTVAFRVMYPCLRHHSGASTYAWFRCAFRGVSWFHLAADRTDRLNDPLGPAPARYGRGQPVEFDVAEINTLEEEIARARRRWRRPAYSLLINTFPGDRLIGLVFQQVTVTPVESAAWALMVQSGEWDIHLYERGLRTFAAERGDSGALSGQADR